MILFESTFLDLIFGFNNIFISLFIDKTLALELINNEFTLIALYFIFLPFIIQDKKKEVYLGYNVSEWILTNRHQNKEKINTIISDFTTNLSLIMISIALYIFNQLSFIFILFIIFIIILYTQIVDYIRLITEDSYKNEIETAFLQKAVNNKNETILMLKDSLKDNNYNYNYSKNSLIFMLKNINITNMDEIVSNFCNELLNQRNQIVSTMVFNELSNSIDTARKQESYLNITIHPSLIRDYLIFNVNEQNILNTTYFLENIIYNNISRTIHIKSDYNNILNFCYYGITNNNSISNKAKIHLKKIVFKNIKYDLKDYQEINPYAVYLIIFNLFKDFIDEKDKTGIEFMKNNLQDNLDIYNEIYYNILLTILIYFYYLIKIEKEPYIFNEDKKYFNSIYLEIKKIAVNNLKYYSNNVDQLFEWIDEISLGLEKFVYKDYDILSSKSPTIDNAIMIAKRTLFILFKSNYYSRINDNDLKAFSSIIIGNHIIQEEQNKINEFAEFIGQSIIDENLNIYINKLLEYADNKFKEEIYAKENIDYNTLKLKDVENYLIKDLRQLEIFNEKKPIVKSKTIKASMNDIIEIKDIDLVLSKNITKYIDIKLFLEQKIINYLSKENFFQITYNLNNEQPILKKAKELSKTSYSYIRPIGDILGENYKLGVNYLNTISKFNIININYQRYYIIDDYKCYLNNVKIIIRDLNTEELSKLIETNKIGNNYYINNNGFNIILSKNEITDFYKKQYASYEITFEINISNKKGYRFIREK